MSPDRAQVVPRIWTPGRGALASQPALLFLGGVLAFTVPVLYMLLWWNRFAGLSDGMFFLWGQQILAGKMPYRDFYLGIPPLQPLKMAALLKLFGPVLLFPRAVAVLERGIFSVVVYLWLSRIFRLEHALLATLVGAILFCGDPADLLFSYHHDSVILAILSGLFASIAFSQRGPRTFAASLASGLCAGLSMMTKQTVGIAATLVPPVVFLLAAWAPPRCTKRRPFLAGFSLGWLLPAGILVGWIAREGALPQFIEQVFLRGPSSKGSLLSVLTRPVSTPLMHGLYRQEFLLALIIVAVLLALSERPSYSEPGKPVRLKTLVLIAAACCAATLAGLPLSRSLGPRAVTFFVETTSAYVGLVGCLAITGWGFGLWAGKRLGNDEGIVWFLAASSCSVAYMLSLSWAVYSPMAFPSLSLVIVFSLSRLPGTVSARVLRGLVMAGAVAAAAAASWSKLAIPYDWRGPREPSVWQTNTVSTLPELRGLVLSRETAQNMDGLTRVIQEYSGDTDSVFAYPYFPLINVLTHRQPSTFALVHFFDVTPDYVAEADAALLLRKRPAVLVYEQPQAEDLEFGEAVFRGGNRSGQRRLVEALDGLAREYRLVYEWPLPGRRTTLMVYARNDRVSR